MYMYYPPPLSHVPLLAPALYPGLSTRARCPELVDIGRARRRVVVSSLRPRLHHGGGGPRAAAERPRGGARHAPHAHRLVVGRRREHVRVARVPRDGVDGARVARQHLLRVQSKARRGGACKAKQGGACKARQGGACKARRRALRPGSPPGSTRSGSLRAVPGILGHPRPIRHVAPAGAVAKWASFSTWGETSSSDALCRCQM